MPNSNTLNLLSDSTFGDKLDEQNAILEDIRDNLGGNLAGTIATIETSPAAAAHAVGEYIYYNTKLYKVTAAISLGDTLTVGTNIAETKVMNEIPSVTNSIASGSTDVPTSGAVYSAIQSASGMSFVVPKPYGEATINDDVFISNSSHSQAKGINRSYIIQGNTIFLPYTSSTGYYYLWVKGDVFGVSNNTSIFERFTPIITSTHNTVNSRTLCFNNSNKFTRSTNDNEYYVYTLIQQNKANSEPEGFVLLYTP